MNFEIPTKDLPWRVGPAEETPGDNTGLYQILTAPDGTSFTASRTVSGTLTIFSNGLGVAVNSLTGDIMWDPNYSSIDENHPIVPLLKVALNYVTI